MPKDLSWQNLKKHFLSYPFDHDMALLPQRGPPKSNGDVKKRCPMPGCSLFKTGTTNLRQHLVKKHGVEKRSDNLHRLSDRASLWSPDTGTDELFLEVLEDYRVDALMNYGHGSSQNRQSAATQISGIKKLVKHFTKASLIDLGLMGKLGQLINELLTKGKANGELSPGSVRSYCMSVIKFLQWLSHEKRWLTKLSLSVTEMNDIIYKIKTFLLLDFSGRLLTFLENLKIKAKRF